MLTDQIATRLNRVNRTSKNPARYVTKLRDAAIKEIASTKTKEVGTVKFDIDHGGTPVRTYTGSDFDTDNWVAQYPGQNIPHIGNGNGGTR